ncbi:RES family NAD+ phosphorylase [Edaphobacter albus]|uniref:RES family NAD+ phosphorylase n=1 Tax=Edaphobacter sp. 4G125 TaxID=2763071 RepID=UPI001646249D|nr:RES family NAD+ phosphorylase [Edaphobacter sp. 4G125]QNI37002.1 RES family NAD+ phosphorylase [Edaphobacter sp. 4G125]
MAAAEPKLELWRISNFRSLSGEGGLLYSARWHTAGKPIVYLAASPAGAMIEVLVHLELTEDELPFAYTLLRVETPASVAVDELVSGKRDDWKTDLNISRSLGDAWLKAGKTALARVPSAILPNTFNYLLNPLHRDAKHIRIVDSSRANFDPRLLRHLRGG